MSQETRTVKVYTTNGMKGAVDTNVETFGELKVLLEERNIDLTNMKAFDRFSDTTYVNDSDALPKEDFTLFLTPQKADSGVN